MLFSLYILDEISVFVIIEVGKVYWYGSMVTNIVWAKGFYPISHPYFKAIRYETSEGNVIRLPLLNL